MVLEVDYLFVVFLEDFLCFIVESFVDVLGLVGFYYFCLGGDFNKGNVLSVVIVSVFVGVLKEEC